MIFVAAAKSQLGVLEVVFAFVAGSLGANPFLLVDAVDFFVI